MDYDVAAVWSIVLYSSKLKTAKQGRNTRSNLILQKDIPLNSKIDVLNSLSRSIISYGGQFWRFQHHGSVEKLGRNHLISHLTRLIALGGPIFSLLSFSHQNYISTKYVKYLVIGVIDYPFVQC